MRWGTIERVLLAISLLRLTERTLFNVNVRKGISFQNTRIEEGSLVMEYETLAHPRLQLEPRP